MDRCQQIERSIIKKYRKPIWNQFIGGLKDYQMIQAGDKIAVCLSGGKDSFLLAKCLQELQRHGSEVPFELEFIVMDPGYRPKNRERIEALLKKLDIPAHIYNSPIFSVVEKQEGSPCYLCARMRRGYLYKYAKELGCNKIALGHHFDDAVETFLMSLLFEGRISCFQPVTDLDRTGIIQIRPMLYIHEKTVDSFAARQKLPVLTNRCPVDKITKRAEVKDLIYQLSATYPDLKERIFGAMQRFPLPEWEPKGRYKRPKDNTEIIVDN